MRHDVSMAESLSACEIYFYSDTGMIQLEAIFGELGECSTRVFKTSNSPQENTPSMKINGAGHDLR